jgi:hypothetical protein
MIITTEYTILVRDVCDTGLTLDVSPCTNYLVNDAIARIMTKHGIVGRVDTIDLDTYRSVRISFDSRQTADKVGFLIEGLTKDDITKDETIEDAGQHLLEALEHLAIDDFYMVAINHGEQRLFLYTRTRARGNQLASYVGHVFHGYRINVKAIGRVRPIGTSLCPTPRPMRKS